MYELYATAFTVRGRTAARSLIEALTLEVSTRKGLDQHELLADGEADHGATRWVVLGPPAEPSGIELIEQSELTSGLARIDRIEIVDTGKAASVRGSTVARRTGEGVARIPSGVLPPRFIQQLISEGKARDGSDALTSGFVQIDEGDAEAAWGTIVGHRKLPLVVVTPDWRTDSYTWDLRRVGRVLSGLGHLRAFKPDLSWWITNHHGKHLSVYGGAVRVYRPGFDLRDSPYDHPLWLGEAVAEQPDQIVEEVRRVCVAEAQLTSPQLWSIRTRRQQQLLKAANPAVDTGPDEDWLAFVEELIRERDQALADLDRLTAASGPASEEPPPETVREALERVMAGNPAGLVALESAFESASESPYRNAAYALQALEVVVELASAYRSDSLQEDFKTFCQKRGFQLGYVSSATRSRWRRDYERTWEGRKIELSDHIKIGTGTPDNHLRVYWYRDADTRTLVLGHVGTHLTDSRS